jgi:DNA-directed RNA polymerase-3 subunit RPC5
LDILSRRSKRAWGGASDSESDEGPPPDPDEAARVSVAKKEKRPTAESKEVQVSARKIEDKGGTQVPGSLSAVRKEILHAIRAEEDVSWEDLQFYDVSVRNYDALHNVRSTAVPDDRV